MTTPAKKKPAKPQKSKKILSKRQWLKIRHKWENDPRKGFHWLARESGISKGAIAYHHKIEGWVKAVGAEKAPSRKEIDLGGRPTQYKPEYCQKIINFFKDGVAYRELTDPKNPSRVNLVPNRLPNLARFAAEIGCSRQTLWYWANVRNADGTLVNPEFSDAYQTAVSFQEALLIEGGVAGTFNPPTVAILLRNMHHYQPVVPAPIDNNSSRMDTDELDQIYEAALKEAAERQKAIEGRFERLVGSGTTESSYQSNSPGNGFDDD
jgi:hypothetical protein